MEDDLQRRIKEAKRKYGDDHGYKAQERLENNTAGSVLDCQVVEHDGAVNILTFATTNTTKDFGCEFAFLFETGIDLHTTVAALSSDIKDDIASAIYSFFLRGKDCLNAKVLIILADTLMIRGHILMKSEFLLQFGLTEAEAASTIFRGKLISHGRIDFDYKVFVPETSYVIHKSIPVLQ